MKKKLIFLAVLLSAHVGAATAQVSDAVQGTADGGAAADSLGSLAWQLAIMAGGGVVGGAMARNGVTSGSDVAAEAGTFGGLLLVGTIVTAFLLSDVPDDLSESIVDRPDDYRMSFEEEYRRTSRSKAFVRGILGGLVAGVAYAVTAGAGNDRLDNGPSFTLISARIRF